MSDACASGRPRLVMSVSPHPGESLTGLLARSGERNLVPNPTDLLAHIHCAGSRLGAIAVKYADRCDELSALLGVEPEKLQPLFYNRKGGPRYIGTEIDYYGVVMPGRCREGQRRRISSSSLRAAPFHRAAWELRFLSWCPESHQYLTDICPSCNGHLTWSRLKGIHRCELCSFDLRDYDTRYVSEQDRPAATFISQLVSYCHEERGSARGRLHSELRELQEIDLLRLTLMLASSFRWNWSQTEGALREADLTVGVSLAFWSQGVERLLAWPESADRLIEEARSSSTCDTCEVSTELGLIGQRMHSSREDVSKVLRARIGMHYARVGSPLSSRLKRRAGWYKAGWIEIASVEAAVGVSRSVIYQAVRHFGAEHVVDGEAPHAQTLVREDDVRRWADGVKRAASVETASQTLGIPEFAIWELVASGHLGLLEPIVRELCGRKGPLDIMSIVTLRETLRARCKVDRPTPSDLVPLHQVVMAAKTAVPRWTEALDMICHGALAAFWNDAGEPTFVRGIFVERQASDLLEKAACRIIGAGDLMPRFIDHEAAADLLREKRYKILALVTNGTIISEKGGIGKRIVRQSLYEYAQDLFERRNGRR